MDTIRSAEERCAPTRMYPQCSNLPNTPPKCGSMEGRTTLAKMSRVGGLVRCGECGIRRRRARDKKTTGILVQVCFIPLGARISPHQQRPYRVAGMSFAERTARPHLSTTAQCVFPPTQMCPTSSTGGRTALSSSRRLPIHHLLSSPRVGLGVLVPVLPYDSHLPYTSGSPCPNRAHCDPVPGCALRIVARRASGCRSEVQRRHRWCRRRRYNRPPPLPALERPGKLPGSRQRAGHGGRYSTFPPVSPPVDLFSVNPKMGSLVP